VSAVDLSQNAISNCTRIEIDEQILTADASDLLLNGIPIATITNISNVADWAMFPAVANVAMNGFNLSGAGAGSFTSLSVNGQPIGSASQWATFGAVTDINVSGNAINNAASVQVGNRTITTQAGTANAPYLLINGSNILSNWSSFTANSAVSLGANDINNVKDLTASGTARSGAVITNALTLSSDVITADGLFVYVNGSNGVERWAQFPAVAQVNMSGNNIIGVDQIDASGVSCVDSFINTLYVYTPDNNSSAVVTSTNSGATLLLNSVPLLTSADVSSAANWATYPAIANVNMSGNAITSTTDLSLTSGGSLILRSTSNIKVQSKMETGSIEMTGLLSQTFAGSGCNFFGSAVQVGTNGILPTDNFGSANIYGGNIPVGLSTLYVQGGTTLDGGGSVHGITIGTLPVAGINTQRIDVLPLGIEMTTPTFITMNGLGAANIAMGGAIAIAAGSYTTIEHGIGLGENGIFLQNSGRGPGCRVIFTGGGTLFNANEVQASNIVNPNGVQFWGGVYNPSGGSIPIAPGVYGRAVVDISTQNCFFASLTGGTLPTQNATSNSVYIGQLAGMTLSGGNSSIVIGDNNRMSNQGNSAIAIGVDSGAVNMGTRAIALGYGCGVQSMGNDSIGIGTFAGSNSLGSNSVAIGANAGQLGIGVNSVVVGANAGSNATGSNSVAIGAGASRSGAGTYTTSVGYNACSNNLGSNSIAIGALSANGGMGEFSTYIGTCFTAEGAVPTKTIVLNNTGLAMNPTNGDAFYVGKLTQVASSPGFNMTAHNNGTGEFIQPLTSSLSLDSSISNTPRISYDTGLLTTQIDGLLKVAGNAEFSQSVTADTTLNVLGLTTLSSCVITNVSAGATSEVMYWDPSTGKLAHAPAANIGLTPSNTFVVAENGSDITGDGSFISPFQTIQYAISQCPSGAQDVGQTIWIMAGLYVENLTISDKNINFRGSGDTQHTYNTTIRGNMTITSSNTNRSYRTISFQDIQIQNYTATTGKAITISTSGTGKGRLVLSGCYVIGASTGVSLLDATATNCDWIVIATNTRFYTSFAYSGALIDLGGNQGTACGFTLNQSLVEYESPAGSTNSLIKVGNYSAFTSTYSTITQPLNPSFNNSALTKGLVWITNLPNSGVVATSTNGANIGTTLLFSGTQATLGVAGTPAMFIERGCPSVYLLTGTTSVRSNSTPTTHAIAGSTSAGTKTIIYFSTQNMMTTFGSANKVDATNLTTTLLTPLS